MRQTMRWIVGVGAALAAFAAAAPAQACQAVDPCGGYYGYYGYGYGYSVRERLPDPAGPQYYYVNQGPTYTGPGNFAPVPTYQERAVSGWSAYTRPYYYGYNGGPYGNATSHYYDGAPGVQGPVVYTYRPYRHRVHFRPHRIGPKYYYVRRPSLRYGYHYRGPRYGYTPRPGYAPRFYAPRHSMMHGPRMHHMPRYAAPRSVPTPRPAPRPLPKSQPTYRF